MKITPEIKALLDEKGKNARTRQKITLGLWDIFKPKKLKLFIALLEQDMRWWQAFKIAKESKK